MQTVKTHHTLIKLILNNLRFHTPYFYKKNSLFNLIQHAFHMCQFGFEIHRTLEFDKFGANLCKVFL